MMNRLPISPMPSGLSRRTVLGASVAGAAGAAGLLSACGVGSADDSAVGSDASPDASSAAPDAGAAALVKTSDVPVGSGVILTDKKVVVTQPTAGEFKGFSAICTHMHCPVSTIKGDTITCNCHGSQYSTVDGSVKGGPAPRPLPPVNVKVEGDEVVEA
jgi:Rieske Fe-S protein